MVSIEEHLVLVAYPASAIAWNTRSTRPVLVRSTRSPPTCGRTCPSNKYRMVAIAFGDFARARRLCFDTAAFGQSAATQSSFTSSNIAKRSRRGPGAASSAHCASSSAKPRSASARSIRSTLRRDPSGNRTHAIHRCLPVPPHRQALRHSRPLSLDVANFAKATFALATSGCHPQTWGTRKAADLPV